MRSDEESGNSDCKGSSEVKALKAFLPYIPLPIKKKLSGHSEGDGVIGKGSAGGKEEGKGENARGDVVNLRDYIFLKLANSPIPLRLVHNLAKKVDFAGLRIIKDLLDKIASDPLIQSKKISRKKNCPSSDFSHSKDSLPDESGVASLHEKGNGLDHDSLLEGAFDKLFSKLGERRSGQLDMAKAVLKAFDNQSILIVEAGTGTGKSLAYLIPAIIHSACTGRRIVISTHTKHLQNQLFSKDIPIAVATLGMNVKVTRLMGRENYICTERAIRLVKKMLDEFAGDALDLALSVILSDEGLVYSLPEAAANADRYMLVPPKRCLMVQCYYADRCPLMLARNQALKASLVLVNHSLVMTDYQSDRAILGEYSGIIFDEAHNIERSALENLSIGLSKEVLQEVLEPLDFVRRGDEGWKLLCSFAQPEFKDRRKYILDLMRSLAKSMDSIFEQITEQYNAEYRNKGVKTRYKDGSTTFEKAKDIVAGFVFDCNRLKRLLNPILEIELHSEAQQLQREVAFVCDGIDSLVSTTEYLTSTADDDYAFWFDWDSDGNLREIAASPLFVDRPFADFLETMCDSAVFTSATLSQGGNFSFFISRLGLDKAGFSIDELSIPSPFPFDENCTVFAASDHIDPTDEESFAPRIAELIERIVCSIEKRILVLFTSYRMCNATADSITDPNVRKKLIVQTGSESREVLAERLRKMRGGVLLGVASFWEGIDFPGEELEVLVITKAPFLVPSEPIVQARSEKLESMGKDPFEVMQIPEAALRLKQGVGRLIRRKDDMGVVVLLDSRLINRSYGDVILRELPVSRKEILPMEEIPRRVARWFMV